MQEWGGGRDSDGAGGIFRRAVWKVQAGAWPSHAGKRVVGREGWRSVAFEGMMTDTVLVPLKGNSWSLVCSTPACASMQSLQSLGWTLDILGIFWSGKTLFQNKQYRGWKAAKSSSGWA